MEELPCAFCEIRAQKVIVPGGRRDDHFPFITDNG